jgi:hypothetical protein
MTSWIWRFETLEESKQLCAEHDLSFDGEDMLREYVQQKRLNERMAV